jgi:hypothetical protein
MQAHLWSNERLQLVQVCCKESSSQCRRRLHMKKMQALHAIVACLQQCAASTHAARHQVLLAVLPL